MTYLLLFILGVLAGATLRTGRTAEHEFKEWRERVYRSALLPKDSNDA